MSIFAGKDPIWTARRGTVSAGLVGHWDSMALSAADRMGNIWYDISGNNNHGTLTNGASFDRIGVNFDGVDDKVTATHPLGVGVSQCTFSVWMRKVSASDVAISSIGSEIANSRFHISWFSDGQLYCTVENGSGSYGEFTPSLTTNFRNYCLVYDGTQTTNANKLRVFLDGQQISLIYTGTIPATAISTNAVTIGAGSGVFSKNQQDDIRIYNRALSNAEILRNFNATRARFGV